MNCTNEPVASNCVACTTYLDCEPFYRPDVFDKITCVGGRSNNGTARGCSCYAFFGFVGENCDAESALYFFHLFLFAATLLYSLFLTALSGATLKVFVLSRTTPFQLSKPNIQSTIACMLGASSYVCLSTGYLLMSTGVDATLAFERSSVKGVFIGLSVLTTMFAVLTITIGK